jgi:hypothetical protein
MNHPGWGRAWRGHSQTAPRFAGGFKSQLLVT